MSYVPSPRADVALLALTKDGDLPEGLVGLGEPYRQLDLELLRELLIAMCCPAPCAGYVNDVGWHKLCEAKADAAIAALDLWQSKPAVSEGPTNVEAPDTLCNYRGCVFTPHSEGTPHSWEQR